MIWRCIDQRRPLRNRDEEEWIELLLFELFHGEHGQGGEYMIGFEPSGDGCGIGFDHGMLKGGNVDWGDR